MADPPFHRGLALGLCTGIVAIAFEAMAVSTAMPAAARELDGLPLYAWVFSLFVIGMLLMTVLAGRVADRDGPVRPLIGGFVIFATGLIIAGIAHTMEVLLIGRALQGLGAGALNLGLAVTVAHAFTAAQRPLVMAWFSTSWILPSFIGPPIAAWLTRALSWHWVFFAVLPLLVLAAALGGPALRRLARAGVLAPGDVVGSPVPAWAAFVVALAAAGVQYAGQRLDMVAIPIAVAGFAGLVVALPPLMPAGFLRFAPGLSPTMVTRALVAGAFFGAQSFFPLMMVQMHQWSLFWAGATLTVGSVGWTAGAWLQSHRSIRWRRDQLIIGGCVSLVLGLAVVGVLAWRPGLWLGLVVAGWILAGLGMGLAISSTNLAVITLSGRSEQGRNNAGLQVADALGNSLFVGVAGTIFAGLSASYAVSVTFGWLLTAMTLVAIASIAVAWRIGPVRD